MLKELIHKTRSIRRYFEEYIIVEKELLEFIDLTRYAASAKNAQPLKYIFSNDKAKNDIIFNSLSWAAYLTQWKGPEPGERPSAYIIMLGDTSISSNYFCDHGIAAQNILLAATEKGLGGCILSSVNREELREKLHIPGKLEIIQVIALGKPKETVVIETLQPDGDIKYWRDDKNIHHVPKRSLDEIVIKL
jgi:nitroreductase